MDSKNFKNQTTQIHYIHPGDYEKIAEITFSLSELKTLHGIVVDSINQNDADILPHHQLAEKLEYCITEIEL